MTVVNYLSVKVVIDDGAVISQKLLRKFLFNVLNYTKIDECTPTVYFKKVNKEGYTFVSNGTNFGYLTNQSIQNDTDDTEKNVLQSLKRVAKKNNHNFTINEN